MMSDPRILLNGSYKDIQTIKNNVEKEADADMKRKIEYQTRILDSVMEVTKNHFEL